MPRTVIVAHGHPAFGFGGGEIAAHRHFEHMRAQGADVVFLGAVQPKAGDRRIGDAQGLMRLGEGDFVMRTPPMSGFRLDFPNIADEHRVLEALLSLEGDAYHFHHVWNIGIATIARLMKARPDARFILTLHEYLAICALHGQMLKAESMRCAMKPSRMPARAVFPSNLQPRSSCAAAACCGCSTSSTC